MTRNTKTRRTLIRKLKTKMTKFMNMDKNMRTRKTRTIFNNQQIKSNLMMGTVWKNYKKISRKDTRGTSLTLWDVSLLMKNSTQINAANLKKL